jgi:peptidoglycan/LPS O-acetylase OafA/YrhL
MLDVYRFVLALCVVQAHLLAGGVLELAWQAVFSFYALSGFLMTLVLNEVYGFGPGNFARFFANRVLRLYPSYYVLGLITISYIVLVSPANQLNGGLYLPQPIAEWLANVFIVGLVGVDQNQVASHRLVPSAWSLAIEIFCYALLAAYFAKSAVRLSVLLGIGVTIAAVHFARQFWAPAADYGFFDHYSVLQAGLIPFAIGGLAYFYRRSAWFDPSGQRIGFLCLLLILNGGLGYLSDFHRFVGGLYIAIAINFFLIPMLFRYDEVHGKQPWQTTLGGIAYPLFIAHWFIGTVVFLQFGALTPRGIPHFLLSTIASVLFALALYFGIDRNAEKLRARLKRPRVPQQKLWIGATARTGHAPEAQGAGP